ncbi:hypothetical protein EVA_20660 [gut metagenome]|uniref:Uncharacterized protein n=1 Tax=gut metagenome TaxID=749906 RepID=J9FNQ6_9ZZZZ
MMLLTPVQNRLLKYRFQKAGKIARMKVCSWLTLKAVVQTLLTLLTISRQK